MRRLSAVVLILVLSLTIGLKTSGVVFAESPLTADQEAEFSQNDDLYWQPCEVRKSGSGSDAICGENQNYAGDKVFNEEELAAIEKFQPIYEEAASKYGFPWQILAVLHYRENSLKKSNPNGMGVYQLDSYTAHGTNNRAFLPVGPISDDELKRQSEIAAGLINDNYGKGLDLNTDNGVKQMFFNYNGAANIYKQRALDMGFSEEEANRGEGSPYVMNRYDARRDPKSSETDEHWIGKFGNNGYVADQVDAQWGTFTAYIALTCEDGEDGEGELNDDSDDDPPEEDDGVADTDKKSDFGNGNAQKIAETAFKLAHTIKSSANNPKDEFIEATKALGTWDRNKSHGSDCGFFVKAVLSTANPDIVYKPGNAIMDKFRDKLVSGDKKYTKYWDVINFSDGKNSKLKSGDVVWWWDGSGHQHYWIAAKKDGKMYKIDASWGGCKSCGHWGKVSSRLYMSKSQKKRKKMYIFRAKGGESTDSCDSKDPNSKNINGTAAALAWPLGTESSSYKYPGGAPTPAFAKAWEETNVNTNGEDGTDNAHQTGAYSSGFTAAVVRYSGYDRQFTSESIDSEPTQAKKADPELWDVSNWDGKKSSLKGGDILNCTTSGHSLVIVEDGLGELYIAEAVNNSSYGRIKKYKEPCNGKAQIIRAKSAKNSSNGVSVTGDNKSSSTDGTVSKSAKGAKNLGAAALELAWPNSDFTGKENFKSKPTDKFLSFYKDIGGRTTGVEANGRSCDFFAHTAIVYAGLEGEDFPWYLTEIRDRVTTDSNWQEVSMKDTRKVDEYQHGDLVLFFDGGGVAHVGIFVEDGGKKYVAQASHADNKDPGYFGVVKDTYNITSNYKDFTSIRVFRHKNNQASGAVGDDECDLCPDGDDDDSSSSSGGLKEGGMTLAEAKEFMKSYHDAAMGKYYKKNKDIYFGSNNAYIHDDNCPFGVMNNCTAFSQWFVNNYTSIGPKKAPACMGWKMAQCMINAGLKKGNEPRPYAVFSYDGPTAAGHTGIILGVDKSANKAIIGEASCSDGRAKLWYEPHAVEKNLNEMKGWRYAYTDNVINIGTLKE